MTTTTRRTRGAPRPLTLLLALAALAVVGCEVEETDEVGEGGLEAAGEDAMVEEPAGAMTPAGAGTSTEFTAQLQPVNDDVVDGTPSGQVRIVRQGDSLRIQVTAEGLPPGMVHLQHFHGFEDGSPARCPGADADANDDGVIDVVETESVAGVTMVPFHGDPLSMEIQAEGYPTADEQGRYSYETTVPLDSLRSAFEGKFGASELALADRVVFIHGVPDGTQLPASAGSVLGAPAHVTLPIACGELDPVGSGSGS